MFSLWYLWMVQQNFTVDSRLGWFWETNAWCTALQVSKKKETRLQNGLGIWVIAVNPTVITGDGPRHEGWVIQGLLTENLADFNTADSTSWWNCNCVPVIGHKMCATWVPVLNMQRNTKYLLTQQEQSQDFLIAPRITSVTIATKYLHTESLIYRCIGSKTLNYEKTKKCSVCVISQRTMTVV